MAFTRILYGIPFLLCTFLSCGDPPADSMPPADLLPLVDSEPGPCSASGITAQSRFQSGDPIGHPAPFATSALQQARAVRIRDQAWIRQAADARQKVRLGDILLINDKIAVYIEDAGLSDGYQALGGDILAAEPVGPDGWPSGTSQYGETMLIFGGYGVKPDTVTILNDGSNGAAAVVRVSGHLDSIPFVSEGFGVLVTEHFDMPAAIDYILAPGEVRVKVRVSLMNDAAQDADLSTLQMVGFFHQSRSQYFTPERGFGDSRGSQLSWIGFDNQGASFAFRWLGGSLDQVYNGAGFNMYRMGGLMLGGCQKTTLDYGEFIISGPGIDNLRAAVRQVDGDHSWRAISGTVKDSAGAAIANAYVHARSVQGQYLTRVQTDKNGEFAMHVPAQAVDLLVTQGGFALSAAQRLLPSENTATIALPQNGRLIVHARDADPANPQALPVRIQVIPDSPPQGFPPSFGIGQEMDGRAVVEFAIHGEAQIALPPGPYQVLISRGFEWEIYNQKLTLSAGMDTEVNATLAHSVDSTGVMCADFHIHSFYSADSSDGVYLKVKSAIADGLEIPVSSEHEWIIDFQPLIKELGLDAWAFGFPSEEFTTFTWGHFGIIPLFPRPDQLNNGAISWIGKLPPEVFRSINALPEKPVLIINHPQSRGYGSGYFYVADFQRSTAQGDPLLWSNDFEAVELFNGSDFESNRDGSVADFFALLNSGHKVWGLGNSDSHFVHDSPVGYPRNCLRFGHDDPTRLSAGTVRDVLRAGQVTVSGGLYMTVEGPGGIGPGGEVTAAGDPLTFQVVVQAPSWLIATQLEVIVNGETEKTIELQETGGGSGHRYEIPVTIKPGTRPQNWVVFHAKAQGRDLGPIFPGRMPFAMSNPIYF